jgi:hypothetical protein
MKKVVLVLAVLASLVSVNAIAHGGRTDANGCHVDSRTGIQHCHWF